MGQVLGKLGVSCAVQSLCDVKVKGLTEVLAGPVCKAGPTELAILKLFRMQICKKTPFDAVCKPGSPGCYVKQNFKGTAHTFLH